MKKLQGWKQATLKDLVFFQRGFDITKAQQKSGDIPVISSSGTKSYHAEAKVKGPGVIIGRKGTLGSVFFSGGDYWPHDTTLWSKKLNGNNPKFVYHFVKTLNLWRYDVGNSNPTLNRNHIHDLEIQIPSIAIQDKIADILSAYDNLIENNRRRIQLLEESARLLYKEWFVHLRFPGHEHVTIHNGIPDGWEKVHLSKIVNTQYGFTASATSEAVGPKFLRGTDINKTSYIDWSSVPYCPEDGLDYPKYALDKGDILLIRMADPGKVAIVETKVEAIFASYLVRLSLKQDAKVTPYFLFYVLDSDKYQGFISGASTGSTRKSASAKLLTDFEFFIPSHTLLSLFEEYIMPIRQQTNALLSQNASLRSARDLLLPRLMNGEIAV